MRTAAPSDFITSAGHRGGYILSARDLITNDIEVAVEGALLDGMLCLASCDKTPPGQLMAAARLNIPSVIVACGYQPSGTYRGKHGDIEDVFLAAGHVPGAVVPPGTSTHMVLPLPLPNGRKISLQVFAGLLGSEACAVPVMPAPKPAARPPAKSRAASQRIRKTMPSVDVRADPPTVGGRPATPLTRHCNEDPSTQSPSQPALPRPHCPHPTARAPPPHRPGSHHRRIAPCCRLAGHLSRHASPAGPGCGGRADHCVSKSPP